MHKRERCALSANAQGWDLRAVDSQIAFVTGLVGDQQCNNKLNSCAEEGKVVQKFHKVCLWTLIICVAVLSCWLLSKFIIEN